ncbi:MAG: hypothetical protein QF535_10065 [Anaerolineales bacterium]|nr:hypothetical protein [Anaerolineales bacterium]
MSKSNYRKWDESQSPQWKYIFQKESVKKREQKRKNNGPARLRGKNSNDYDSALQEAKKIKQERMARNEEIDKLLQEEKERNTVYR